MSRNPLITTNLKVRHPVGSALVFWLPRLCTHCRVDRPIDLDFGFVAESYQVLVIGWASVLKTTFVKSSAPDCANSR